MQDRLTDGTLATECMGAIGPLFCCGAKCSQQATTSPNEFYGLLWDIMIRQDADIGDTEFFFQYPYI